MSRSPRPARRARSTTVRVLLSTRSPSKASSPTSMPLTILPRTAPRKSMSKVSSPPSAKSILPSSATVRSTSLTTAPPAAPSSRSIAPSILATRTSRPRIPRSRSVTRSSSTETSCFTAVRHLFTRPLRAMPTCIPSTGLRAAPLPPVIPRATARRRIRSM